MWRRTHREEMEQREKEKRLEKERKQREKEFFREQQRREKIKRMEREEAELSRKRMKTALTRGAYEESWNDIVNRVRLRRNQGSNPNTNPDDGPDEMSISPAEIPWPVRPTGSDGETIPSSFTILLSDVI